MAEHYITVHYFNTDDGIWLECACGWKSQVRDAEFGPTVEQLSALADTHYREAKSNAQM